MEKEGKDLKKRKSILMDLWNDLITIWESNPKKVTREYVIERLKNEYNKEKISPIKGATDPKDLYDKEMTSLYVLGKYGMGLEIQYPELFDLVFAQEIKMDQINEILLSDNLDGGKDKILAIIGGINGNTIAKIMRLGVTKEYFGFIDQRSVVKLADSLKKLFPNQENEVNKYMKFYAAFKISKAIDDGTVRNRIMKEALRQALAIELNIDKKNMPRDNYIMKVASGSFNIPKKVIRQIFPYNKSKKLNKNENKSN
ncbi:hypothetical protein Calag_1131 [Caldisphaera lagunensis DSM 15908]|uniref:DUF2192 domain-containing protein n=1 Tax=Caldisphaera lagunensis (strain DSM 15908 / JCM 11604 / ANMR 0165 / IC-154) TaxID=1056495 RepID=L0AAB9_CALLD|nr:DUF2192 domain-containing protein [Caldisphaera lagunensis]AFZ70853.1 hypothetical protein Calag_1131 [Caldisphaera lagunensis DSM 15908]